MPVAPKRPCTAHVQPPCRNKTTKGGLCYVHLRQLKATHDARRPTAAQRGYDQAWRDTRAAYLKAHPYCECDQCIQLPEWERPLATDVDHRDGQGPNGIRGHDWTNLRSMTHAHHSRRTARDQGFARGKGMANP